MSVVIPDELVKASGMSEEELMLELVILLFQKDKISLGKASELAGMNPYQGLKFKLPIFRESDGSPPLLNSCL